MDTSKIRVIFEYVVLRDKKFSSQEAVQNAFTQFVESRSPEFYRKGINELPIRWQQCIDNNVIYGQYVSCEPKKRESKHLFPLLGYLHGYKIGQNLAYQLPPFVLSPVLILPSINQQQSVNVQKSTSGDNYHETGGTFQIVSPSKLILLNVTEDINDGNEIVKTELNETTKVDNLEKSGLLAKYNQSNCDHDTFRQILTNDTDITTAKTTEGKDNEVSINNEANSETESTEVTTQVYDLNSTTVHTNESITTSSVKEISTSPSSLLQNNTTLSIAENVQNLNITVQNNTANNMNIQSNGSLENSSPNPTTTLASSFRGYSYRNPWYNPLANKVSITTSAYTNYESHLPLANDDRWQSFSSLRKSYPTSDFRPLAGLYHDGYLYKYPLKKTGFIPLNSKYLYFN